MPDPNPIDAIDIATVRNPRLPDGRHHFTFDVRIDPKLAAAEHATELGRRVFEALLGGLRQAMEMRRG